MNVSIRWLEPADEQRVLAWRNADHVRLNMYDDQPIPAVEHARWLEVTLSAADVDAFVIVVDGVDCGFAVVRVESARHGRASWAFYLGDPAMQGRGVGRAVEYLIQHHVFEHRNMAKLSCEVLAFNTAVLRMHEKLGFTREGVLREHVLRSDGRHDVHLFGMLRSDWQRLKGELAQALESRGVTADLVRRPGGA